MNHKLHIMKNSKKGKLNLKDVAKSALVAGGTIVLSSAATAIEAGGMPTTEGIIVSAKIGLFAAVSYLFKNLLTNSKGEFAKAE
jgi:hypothetical protein